MSFRYPDMTIEFLGQEYVVEKIYVSELDFIMIRLWNEKSKAYSTINLGVYDKTQNFISDELRRRRKLITN